MTLKTTINMNVLKAKRPNLLIALCTLTFIGSSASFIVYFLASVFFEKSSELIIKYSNWSSVEAISPLYFTLLMALSAISLIGAIRMWKLHRDGFLLYFFSQVIILFLPVLWINWNAFSPIGAIFTSVFIIGYGLNWKSFL